MAALDDVNARCSGCGATYRGGLITLGIEWYDEVMSKASVHSICSGDATWDARCTRCGTRFKIADHNLPPPVSDADIVAAINELRNWMAVVRRKLDI